MLIAAMLVQAVPPSSAPMPATPPSAREPDVTVVGQRERFRLDARALRAAQAAFAKGRAEFAPAAPLAFAIMPARGAMASAPTVLHLTDGTTTIPVPVDAQGAFVLPPIPAGKWSLTANRARRTMTVQPLILSPGATRIDHRLGDARLQCRVYWAMLKASVPLLAAPLTGTIDLVGPCTSKRVGIYPSTSRPIAAATLQEGARSAAIQVGPNRRSYRLPLADRSFGNDARIRMTLE